jgi:succinoglycan biosynthesis protein ExoM
MIDVSIVIPTYRRPELLALTLAGCLAQQGIDDERVEIVVVDNDPAQSARAIIDAASAQSGPVAVRYVAEARPGISCARNTGVAQAAGHYIAFIDDDEEAEPGWLAAFLETIRRTGADLVVGPVFPCFAEPAGAYACRAYTRDAQLPTGTRLDHWSGIGNSLLDKERCFAGLAEPFDPRLGLSGGEDALFLHQLRRRGGTIAWCAEAAVRESIAADKLATRYLLRREFRGAQTLTYVCTAVSPPERGKAAFWMAVGCAQILLYTPAALALWAVRHRRWLPMAVKAVGGFGKLLWNRRLQPRLYH